MRFFNPLNNVRGRDLLRWLPIVGRNDRYQRYIIFSMARSGSTLLALRLNSHPHVEGLAEIFADNSLDLERRRWWQPGFLRQRRVARMEKLRRDDPNAFVRQMSWGPKMSDVRAAGFKFLWEQFLQLPTNERGEILATAGVKIILLERQDVLAQYVSWKAAMQFGWLHSRTGTKKPDIPKIHVDPEAFAKFARARKLAATLVRQATGHLPRLSITYEDLVAFPARENARLCQFLGIEEVPLTDHLQKGSSTRLADRIDNIDEVTAALRGTDLESYLLAAGIR